MRLELSRNDLRQGREDVSCSLTKFSDFTDRAQAAIRAVGKATFYDGKGTVNETYNAIYPPKG